MCGMNQVLSKPVQIACLKVLLKRMGFCRHPRKTSEVFVMSDGRQIGMISNADVNSNKYSKDFDFDD